jgi:Archaeal ATPase.
LIFDPRPKERLRDLFDREVEINKFVNALNDPAVVVLGLRRTGKSSLINAVLNDYGYRYIYVDTGIL